MEQQLLRKSVLTLPLFAVAVAAGQASFTASTRFRIHYAQLSLSDTGTGAGNTAALLKVNSVAITGASDLSIAGASVGKSVKAKITNGTQYPGGHIVNPGDVITVDITAIPGTTAPAKAVAYLDVTQVDA